MPEADVKSPYEYAPEYLAEILKSVKTIAMVGASGDKTCLLYTSPSPRDGLLSRMPSSA